MRITTEQIKAVLGNAQILNGIDFEARDNQFVGIIGPNGSGKSTLLKCIYRVLTPSDGAVYLDGKPLSEYKVRESAQKVAVVAQHNYYNFEFSVREVVMMGRAPHKKALDRDNAQDHQIVRQALKTVGMEEFEDRSFSTLSGGEQQRIILARALAQQTHCLILDEPTNHLDIKYQLWLMDLVKALSCTVVSAVHDLNIAAMYCDYLYAMKDGRVVARGTPQELLTPELIRTLYDVDANISADEDGILHIFYYPSALARKGRMA
jgi:iron complex transport system ATP-binding protein